LSKLQFVRDNISLGKFLPNEDLISSTESNFPQNFGESLEIFAQGRALKLSTLKQGDKLPDTQKFAGRGKVAEGEALLRGFLVVSWCLAKFG
jgi:hypothetical protein